ncbi:MAG TPA: TlpA disulfide reductase family protein [Thermoanaerobaculia bacterium]|nr:TlpA disulfide reductase family protein [Thermoanaerobaculia bacterium]
MSEVPSAHTPREATSWPRLGRRAHGRRATLEGGIGILLAAALGAATSRLAGDLNAAGLTQRLAQERGRVVLLNFWATWCEPCREEFPSLSRLQRSYENRGLRVLGVSTDLPSQLSAVEKFLEAQQPAFPNYRKAAGGDDQDFIDSVDKSWGGELPFSVLYARDGRKAMVLSGKQSYRDLEREVRKLLNSSS